MPFSLVIADSRDRVRRCCYLKWSVQPILPELANSFIVWKSLWNPVEVGIISLMSKKQRMSIARGIISNPHLLIFGNSTLGYRPEPGARSWIRLEGTTTIIIAKRLARDLSDDSGSRWDDWLVKVRMRTVTSNAVYRKKSIETQKGKEVKWRQFNFFWLFKVYSYHLCCHPDDYSVTLASPLSVFSETLYRLANWIQAYQRW